MSADKLNELRKFFPAAEPFQEGGQLAAYLPSVKVDTPNGVVEFDAVLFPHFHSGYLTRLFTDRQISAPNAKHWTPHTLGGRTWWACSWQGIEGGLPWIDMLANHLRAFR